FSFKDSISFSSLSTTKNNQSFIGVKLGDVNYDWNATVARHMPVNSLQLIINSEEKESIVRHHFSTINFKDIAAMQYTLHFDNTKYEFVRIENNKLAIEFNEKEATKSGNISMLWIDKNAEAKTLEDASELFTLILRSKELGIGSLELGINSDITAIEAWDNNYKQQNIILTQKTVNKKPQTINEYFSVFPNPTNGEVKLSITSKLNEVIKLELSNAKGAILCSQRLEVVKGTNIFNINFKKNKHIPGGLYFVKANGFMQQLIIN
ncbi:MAG: T9SS type A sorting domain-containing protein, partial [Bacteroidetes bacterium]|nr:T9SS type A sorting domain-containing protein [Bacteroidota bacterium]